MTNLPEPDKTADLTDELCPYTIVKAKLALEQLADGQVLRVIVSDEESSRELPLNLAYDGHEVLAVNATAHNRSEVIVRKKGG